MEPLQTIAEKAMPPQNVVSNAGQPEIPSRFQASRKVLFIDAFMTRFIRVGGILVIAAVLGILIFILSQVLPLFRPATVKPFINFQLPRARYVMMGIDEWGELPFAVDDAGKAIFID